MPASYLAIDIGASSGRHILGRLEHGRLALDPPSGERVVLLYRLFTGKVLWKEDERLSRYLEAFRRRFGGKNYYVPETVYQLQAILKYLGGNHGS